jgi:hypothetical protein
MGCYRSGGIIDITGTHLQAMAPAGQAARHLPHPMHSDEVTFLALLM